MRRVFGNARRCLRKRDTRVFLFRNQKSLPQHQQQQVCVSHFKDPNEFVFLRKNKNLDVTLQRNDVDLVLKEHLQRITEVHQSCRNLLYHSIESESPAAIVTKIWSSYLNTCRPSVEDYNRVMAYFLKKKNKPEVYRRWNEFTNKENHSTMAPNSETVEIMISAQGADPNKLLSIAKFAIDNQIELSSATIDRLVVVLSKEHQFELALKFALLLTSRDDATISAEAVYNLIGCYVEIYDSLQAEEEEAVIIEEELDGYTTGDEREDDIDEERMVPEYEGQEEMVTGVIEQEAAVTDEPLSSSPVSSSSSGGGGGGGSSSSSSSSSSRNESESEGARKVEEVEENLSEKVEEDVQQEEVEEIQKEEEAEEVSKEADEKEEEGESNKSYVQHMREVLLTDSMSVLEGSKSLLQHFSARLPQKNRDSSLRMIQVVLLHNLCLMNEDSAVEYCSEILDCPGEHIELLTRFQASTLLSYLRKRNESRLMLEVMERYLKAHGFKSEKKIFSHGQIALDRIQDLELEKKWALYLIKQKFIQPFPWQSVSPSQHSESAGGNHTVDGAVVDEYHIKDRLYCGLFVLRVILAEYQMQWNNKGAARIPDQLRIILPEREARQKQLLKFFSDISPLFPYRIDTTHTGTADVPVIVIDIKAYGEWLQNLSPEEDLGHVLPVDQSFVAP